jgi:hypothetical protein
MKNTPYEIKVDRRKKKRKKEETKTHLGLGY